MFWTTSTIVLCSHVMILTGNPAQVNEGGPTGIIGFTQILPFCAAEQTLQHFRGRFIKEVDASAIVFDLKDKDIISDGDTTTITRNPHPRQQNQFLLACLEKVCTREALMTVCNVISDVPGNPKMKRLGKDMKSMLQGKCSVCVAQHYVETTVYW